MTDYYETKSQPITRVMVAKAYRKVKANRGSGGIDEMSWTDLDKDLKRQLYKLWNRLTSGSYFPMPVKEVEIKKKDRGVRKLGIPTILDRIAQEVVKTHLERIVDPIFHKNSYGYRPKMSSHQAIEMATKMALTHDWAIDIDIKSFFDTIDHDLLMKAVEHYCKDKWVLMNIRRWLNAGIMKKDGSYLDRLTGTPQGGVISPLLSNIFLHVVFDKWMEKNHPEKPFERYADDIVVHCKTEKQAIYLLGMIRKRFERCNLTLHPTKTKVVNFRGVTDKRYPRSLDFLGFTLKPVWRKTKKGFRLMIASFMSAKSKSAVMERFRKMQIHKWRKSIVVIAELLNPIIRGVINYYCKYCHTKAHSLWMQLNSRILKWAMWEKNLHKLAGIKWLKTKRKEMPFLFEHWRLDIPKKYSNFVMEQEEPYEGRLSRAVL
jgi:RNA-directed DNA polymerase